jgi:hypothetical protein
MPPCVRAERQDGILMHKEYLKSISVDLDWLKKHDHAAYERIERRLKAIAEDAQYTAYLDAKVPKRLKA